MHALLHDILDLLHTLAITANSRPIVIEGADLCPTNKNRTNHCVAYFITSLSAECTKSILMPRRYIANGEGPFLTSLEAMGTVDIVSRLYHIDYDGAEPGVAVATRET
jgi:hypothetical protein